MKSFALIVLTVTGLIAGLVLACHRYGLDEYLDCVCGICERIEIFHLGDAAGSCQGLCGIK